ncbi:hypothetical protein CLV58_14024 [Spirosoma oryzae]|uniref:Uncharacterized protein n=1 Tax=Spirosoma oryzae TaxID=1469603 RepID=A0A2T0RSE8_9BACT|nr:hypothetical protein [Spirosoma oryzae]PRY24125.1 hypothetical protein CLV58_14024 [Spirosoma oryzae]
MNPILNQTAPDGNGDDLDNEPDNDTGLVNEPTDDDGDPTGEHDHQQDDNYALGGHVARSSE